MPRGYRLVFLAAFGPASCVLSPPSDAATRNQGYSQRATSRDLNRIAGAIERLPQGEAPDAGCDQRKENRKSDLCAQWKAADAAQQSADWTRRTFWLAIAGTIIGGLTLGAAAYAAFYAKSAADAATKSLEHEVLVSGLQLDSILHIESVSVAGGRSENPVVSFVIRNVGNLPARDLEIIGAWGFREDIDQSELTLRDCAVPKGISPNGLVTVKLPPSDPADDRRLGALFCQFEITWEDREGRTRRISEIHESDGTNFSFLCDY